MRKKQFLVYIYEALVFKNKIGNFIAVIYIKRNKVTKQTKIRKYHMPNIRLIFKF